MIVAVVILSFLVVMLFIDQLILRDSIRIQERTIAIYKELYELAKDAS